ncbi:uncharacterized protein LOC134244859 [Saccostrea cucullata]|uniref:uncharacterized protein LOC134244859 n=1 Tax=Saccostrea cuccullata TaxID=36930 RepID=UPI002ED02396
MSSIVPKGRLPPTKRELNKETPKKRKISESQNDPVYVCKLDHDYANPCIKCIEKSKEISALKSKINELQIELIKQKKLKQKPLSITDTVLKSNKSVRFHTGLPSLSAFHTIYKVIEPKIKKTKYWRGPKHVFHTLKHKVLKKSGPRRFLSLKEEMALTVMKLRLGLLNEDLATRFNISAPHISKIFTTWIKILSKFLGTLVFNPSKEVVRENLPPAFRSKKYSSVRHIIDCTEVFLEKPQNLEVQTKTWSDYKHHHTAKFLISINPSGMINFLSDCWGGRTSDKYITNRSGFYSLIEPYDVIMADRGFQIKEEVTLLHANLMVPPGRRGACQMSADEVQQTKQIANRRIYVEQAIRRMKYFRILKHEVPATLFQHLDDIIKTVAGICNLYPPLPKYK